MLLNFKVPIILIVLFLFISSIHSYAEEEIEDLIDIFELNGKIVAIIKGKRTITFNLRLKEKVLWSESNGYLGAYLTNQHFLVISTSSNSWHALPLRSGESLKGFASLSPYIALLATEDRAVGFDAATNRFVEVRLPIHDELVAADAEKYIAVVITSSRAFGLATETSAFSEIRFGLRETVEAIKITSSKATVRTSDRLLSFEASNSTWNEHRLK